ncbi:hypothetical protein PIB30_058518 [Stylosanthes scabra]|uniref:Uncharacterized protein n=1 Tax=Stylosanthes scabra TaxID=79078 RepID=A0ABU6YKM7_9FABA|nr:hypothetical protein [Stylosanthes scabra]
MKKGRKSPSTGRHRRSLTELRSRRSVAVVVCCVKEPPISSVLPSSAAVRPPPPSSSSDSPTKERRRRADLLDLPSASIRRRYLFPLLPSPIRTTRIVAFDHLVCRVVDRQDSAFTPASVEQLCPLLNHHPSFLGGLVVLCAATGSPSPSSIILPSRTALSLPPPLRLHRNRGHKVHSLGGSALLCAADLAHQHRLESALFLPWILCATRSAALARFLPLWLPLYGKGHLDWITPISWFLTSDFSDYLCLLLRFVPGCWVVLGI